MPSPDPSRRRVVVIAAVLTVVAVGFTVWPSDDAAPVRTSGGGTITAYEAPDAYLAWVPGGFDHPAFRRDIEALPAFEEVVVVAGDTLWLERTEDADGRAVDDPPDPFAYPIDAFAVSPRDYAPFVGASARAEIVRALAAGEAVLGERSARLRRLGPGGRLRFQTGSVRVGAVVPDDAVGWSEVLVERAVGRRLGITHERFLLAQPTRDLSERAFARLLDPFIGEDPLRVDAPDTTPYVRVASGVQPAIVLKEAFGEFAATPQADPVYLTIQPAWVDRNIVTTDVPLLGTVTCHRKLIPMVRGALREIVRAGLASEIKVYSGCWASRTIARTATAPPSTHAYGASIDINAPQSPYGAPPNMHPEVVRIFEEWGFNWGGDFLIPDGHHFEYWETPEPLRTG
ncbi:MAG TPA: M15 family metallopeptidase [Actinomycetota bacterium]